MKDILIVAEIGCNHNGSIERARAMVDVAKACGVDAVKFQAFHARSLISRYAPKAEYQKRTTGTADSQLEMTEKLELSEAALDELMTYAESEGLLTFATPFDNRSISFLHRRGQRIWKIPSGEITNLPYLKQIAALPCADKQILLSTGMATVEEIRTCLDILTAAGAACSQITLLHCNTEYPTPDEDVNLTAITALRQVFSEIAIGFSDHSVGSVAAVGAAALGVSVIEKHFTLDKALPGPDHKASATPVELRQLCEQVRRIQAMRGNGLKTVTVSERKNKIVARRSVVAAVAIRQGERFTAENLTCKRPGNGISPLYFEQLLGRRAMRDFAEDELIEAHGFPHEGSE